MEYIDLYTPESILSFHRSLAQAYRADSTATSPDNATDVYTAPLPPSFYTTDATPDLTPTTPVFLLRYLLYRHLKNPAATPASLSTLHTLLAKLYTLNMTAIETQSQHTHCITINPISPLLTSPNALIPNLDMPTPPHQSTSPLAHTQPLPMPLRLALNLAKYLATALTPFPALLNIHHNHTTPTLTLDHTDILLLPMHHIRACQAFFAKGDVSYLKISRGNGTGEIDAVLYRGTTKATERVGAIYCNPNAGVYELCSGIGLGMPSMDLLMGYGVEGVREMGEQVSVGEGRGGEGSERTAPTGEPTFSPLFKHVCCRSHRPPLC